MRERGEIARLLKYAYPGGVAVDRLMPRLATVAAALNANDPCLARIAAVHLRIPDLPSSAARDALVAEDALRDAPSEVWNLGFTTRGKRIHEIFGDGSLPPLFRIIDKFDFATGEATRIKSIDVRAATYQDASRFTYRISDYVNRLSEYEGGTLQNVTVEPSEITNRILELVVPKGSLTVMQRDGIEAANVRAKAAGTYPVRIIVKEF